MTSSAKVNTLLVLYNGFNALDVNGPLEVLRKSGRSDVFTVTIACETPTAESGEGCIMQRHIPLDQELIDNIADYDILIVPGGNAVGKDSPTQKLARDLSRPFNKLIRAFTALEPKNGSHERILLSICTGATFLSTNGVFNDGRFCTTHWKFIDTLKSINQEAAELASAEEDVKAGTVIRVRFVDSGVTENQVRIITSGGISCGMDASLYIVELRAGVEEAKDTAELVDYAWRRTEGVIL